MFRFVLAVIGAALCPGAAAAQSADPVAQGQPNVPAFDPAFPQQTRAPAMPAEHDLQVTRFAGGLDQPWGIATLPSGDFLVTEKAGRLRRIAADGRVGPPIAGVPEVAPQRQGGLLDVAVSPDFDRDRLLVLTYAKPVEGRYATAAARARLSDDGKRLERVRDIFLQTPPSPNPMHYGSRAVFDGTGHVFVTTGEHFSRSERGLAQDLATTYGKVVRLRLDGTVPPDNPFVDRDGAKGAIWSYGHRNIQGAFLDNGTLWTIEHGPAGGDELNRIVPGRNYGWPVISYGENYSGTPVGKGETARPGMEQPVYYWDPVIAPAGMLRYGGNALTGWQGDLLISSLNPGGIVRLRLMDGRVIGEERLLGRLGRVRDLEIAPDGSVLALIDARDGAVMRIAPR